MMKDLETEELLVRWTDGECLTETEKDHLAYIRQEDPEAIPDREFHQQLRQDLRSHLHSDHCTVPYGSVLNASILSVLREEQTALRVASPVAVSLAASKTSPARASRRSLSVFPRWVAVSAAMAACFLFGLFMSSAVRSPAAEAPLSGSTQPHALTPVVYTPHQTLSTSVISGETGYAHLIVIEGLSAIPDEVDLFAAATRPLRVKPQLRPDFQ